MTKSGVGLLSSMVFEHPYNSALRYYFAPDATPVSVSHALVYGLRFVFSFIFMLSDIAIVEGGSLL